MNETPFLVQARCVWNCGLLLPLIAGSRSDISMSNIQNEETRKFRVFLSDDWKRWMEEMPEFATFVGYPGQNRRWSDDSPAGRDGRIQYFPYGVTPIPDYVVPSQTTAFCLLRLSLEAGGGGFLEGGLVGVGNGVLGAAEAFDVGGELRPFGALEGKEKFVDIAETVLTADKRGLHLRGNGQGIQDLGNGLVEKRVGDREQAHEEETGLFLAETDTTRKILAEITTGESGTDEFRRLASAHCHDGKDGDPAAKFLLAKMGKGLADAMDFRSHTEQRRIQVAQKAIEEGGLALEKGLDRGEVEFGPGDAVYELQQNELVAGDFVGFDHGGLAEEIALKVGKAEMTGLSELLLCFHFFGEECDLAGSILFGKAFTGAGVEKLEIHFEELREFDERSHFGVIDKIVEREDVTRGAQMAADGDDFVRGIHGLENLNDNALRRKKTDRADTKGNLIDVHECACMTGEILQVKERNRIRDDAGGSVSRRLKVVLGTAAEQQFIGEDVQPLVEDRLARNEAFVHANMPL